MTTNFSFPRNITPLALKLLNTTHTLCSFFRQIFALYLYISYLCKNDGCIMPINQAKYRIFMKTLFNKLLTIAMVAILLVPTAATAQSNKKASKTGQTISPTGMRFNLQNPFDKINDNTSGAPWDHCETQKLPVPKDVTPSIPDPLPDVVDQTNDSYEGAISIAFESMRLLYEDMTEEQAKSLHEYWSPLFGYKSQKVWDYLKKFNPLMSQMLLARENYYNLLFGLEQLELDLVNARKVDDKDAFKMVWLDYSLQMKMLMQCEAAVIVLHNRIQDLGDMPNPFDDMRAARRRYNNLIGEKKETGSFGECWIGTTDVNINLVPNISSVKKPLMRYLFTAPTPSGEMYFGIQLSEDDVTKRHDPEDDNNSLSYIRVVQVQLKKNGNKPNITYDGTFQTYFPKPPAAMISKLTYELLFAYEMSDITQNDKKELTAEQLAQKLMYHNAIGNYGNRVLASGFFFKAALRWSAAKKWDKYQYTNGIIPQKALDDFAEAVRQEMRTEMEWKKLPKKERKLLASQGKDPTAMPTEGGEDPNAAAMAANDSIMMEKEANQETLERNNQNIQNNQQRMAELKQDIENKQQAIATKQKELENLYNSLARLQESATVNKANKKTKNTKEDQYITKAQKDIANKQREIDNLSKEIQANYEIYLHKDADNASMIAQNRQIETGIYTYERSSWDVNNEMIIRRNIEIEREKARLSQQAVKGIASMIRQLPVEQREQATKTFINVLEGQGALVNHDLEKIYKVRNAINNSLVGYAEQESAEADMELNATNEKEFAVQMAATALTAAAGGAAVKIATAAGYTAGQVTLISTGYGAVCGAITGFATGGGYDAYKDYIRGVLGMSPKVGIEVFNRPVRKAVFGSISGIHPVTTFSATFFDEYTEEENQRLPSGERAWAALKKATIAGVLHFGVKKGIEWGFSSSTPNGKVKYSNNSKTVSTWEGAMTQDKIKKSGEILKRYKDLEAARTKADWAGNNAEVAKLDKELDQLVASANSDYQFKWQLKYGESAATQARFDSRLQKNVYSKSIDKMTQKLNEMGYDISDMEWRTYRNSSSSGSSSMDLDLGPVSKANPNVEPKYIKNGKTVSGSTFQKDAQDAFQKAHMEEFGVSAKASEMNITNLSHPESYATPEILSPDFNWTTATPKTLKSIKSVIDVKMKSIDANVRLTSVEKVQAQCRELSKELQNMALPKLNNDLKTLTPKTTKFTQTQQKIDDLTKMTEKLKKIGTQATSATEVQTLEQELYNDTGCKNMSN